MRMIEAARKAAHETQPRTLAGYVVHVEHGRERVRVSYVLTSLPHVTRVPCTLCTTYLTTTLPERVTL
jgi:hypothetical protein